MKSLFEKPSTLWSASKARAAHSARRFGRDEDGSLILFGLMIFILMIWSMGVAIDTMRVEAMRTKLQNSLDRAVLAAADLSQEAEAKAVVLDYFAKAGLSDYITAQDIIVTTNGTGSNMSFRRVTATARANMDTMFLNMLGVDTILAAATSGAEEGITDLEISLVLDVSGSMRYSSASGNSKLYEMQESAKDFSYYVQCNPNATRASEEACTVGENEVSISFIPYAEQVIAGPWLLDRMNVTDEHNDSHCIDFEDGDYKQTDIDHGILIEATELTPPVYDPDKALQRTGRHDPWSSSRNASESNRTCPDDSTRQIRPLVEDHLEMEDLIDGLDHGGNTSIDLGMKWAVTLLDPSMRSIIADLSTEDDPDNIGEKVIETDFSNRPYSYDNHNIMKVVVLMTDGYNTDQHYLKEDYRDGPSPIWYNSQYSDRLSIYNESTGKWYSTYDRDWRDFPYGDNPGGTYTRRVRVCYWWSCWYEDRVETYPADPGYAIRMDYPEVWETYTTEWFADWSWLSNPVNEVEHNEKNARLQDICDAANEQGILVYTIAFETDSTGEAAMRGCATTDGHYFRANGLDLDEVFSTIATSINQLRLIQ